MNNDKVCIGCQERLPIESFYKSTRGNRQSRCKPCFNKKTSYYNRSYKPDPVKVSAKGSLFRSENKDKTKAHRLVVKALREGNLTRPETCESCGKHGRIQGHHADYSKPLEVDWLCSSCHTLEHIRLKIITPIDHNS